MLLSVEEKINDLIKKYQEYNRPEWKNDGEYLIGEFISSLNYLLEENL